MDLVIAARKSDLARLQAYMVGDALRLRNCELQIEYRFSSSLGDKNQNDPLWKMPARGVFTQDFHARLVEGEIDMVVHSWKDLPTEDDGTTKFAATLPRADHRDLLLVKKSALVLIEQKKRLLLLTSSPRRMYNLSGFLKRAFPGGLERVEFQDVRGNIQTRLDKMMKSTADGLIVAKAAIDRLLDAQHWGEGGDDFAAMDKSVRAIISRCHWMVLPASQNPPAAAQGALMVEIARGRADLEKMLQEINCKRTYDDVVMERDILKSHGGGCHQKIGVWVETNKFGRVVSIRGKTDNGRILDNCELQGGNNCRVKANTDFALDPIKSEDIFVRKPIALSAQTKTQLGSANILMFASSHIPKEYLKAVKGQAVWVSGVKSWFKFAQQGIWINGCDDNLGSGPARNINILMNMSAEWLTLTHKDSPGSPAIATYKLVNKTQNLDVGDAKYFYWRSGSIFKRAIELQPQIKYGFHACGMGQTYDFIRSVLGEEASITPYVSEQEWLANQE